MKVADGLYSPQVESDQIESITAQVRDLVNSFMDRMFTEQVEVSGCCRCMFTMSHMFCDVDLAGRVHDSNVKATLHKQIVDGSTHTHMCTCIDREMWRKGKGGVYEKREG